MRIFGRKRNQGFSLIELLVVVVIIGILAAISLSKIARAIKKAKEGQTREGLVALRQAVEMYAIDKGEYPNKLTGTSGPGTPTEWSTTLRPEMQQYISALPDCLVCPRPANSGVWNIVDHSLETDPNQDGWRYGYWPDGKVSVNNGGQATDGSIYSSW